MEVCTVSIMAESQISPVEVEPEIAIKCRVEARKRFSTETEKRKQEGNERDNGGGVLEIGDRRH